MRKIACLLGLLLLAYATGVEALAPFPIPPGVGPDRTPDFYSTLMVGTDQYFYFSTDSSLDPRIYVNILRNGSWVYATSPAAITRSNPYDPPTIAMGDVVNHPTSIFRHPTTGQLYKYLMYYIEQPESQNGISAGFIRVAFSNNGVGWTTPIQVNGGGTTCSITVCSEDLAVVFDGTTIFILANEGDLVLLNSPATSGKSYTYLYTASPSNPAQLTKFLPDHVTTSGLVSPNTFPFVYHYLVNIGAAYDPASGYLYMSRGFPYPFDFDGSVPCGTGPFPSPQGLFEFPLRGQLYRLFLGGDVNRLYTGTWELLLDTGGSVGYKSFQGGVCQVTPLIHPAQTVNNLNTSITTHAFLRTREGYIILPRVDFVGARGDNNACATENNCPPASAYKEP